MTEDKREAPPHPAYEVPLDSVIRHNEAKIDHGNALSVTTPSAQWAYAAEFPIRAGAGPHPTGRRTVRVKTRVIEGSIGILCIGEDGQFISETEVSRHHACPFVDLLFDEIQRCQSIIIRNTSSSASEAEISSIMVGTFDSEDESLSEVIVEDSSLRLFTPWSGVTPAGYWTDFLGVRTRADVWAFTPEYLEIYNRERFELPGLPTDREHILDWIPLIDAVAGSGHTFVMVALGAGWGRWLSAGAFAATQLAREYKLVGVEAEPTHFSWMLRHLAQNGIDPARHRIIRAAASHLAGPCWFRIGDAAGWYGQSIVPDLDVPPEITAQAPLWSEVSIVATRLQRVCSVDLRAVVSGLPTIDYMHMDIQGAEADFLEAYPELLQQHVRTVNVGTHSAQIEDRLRTLFHTLKWRCVHDVRLKSAAMVKVGLRDAQRVEFGDGVQVWTNPTLPPANFA